MVSICTCVCTCACVRVCVCACERVFLTVVSERKERVVIYVSINP